MLLCMRHLALLVASLFISYTLLPTVERSRPNVVVFLVDDWGWTDLSLVLSPEGMPNHEWYQTPNMERLAAQGVRFTDAYAASPVCSPTRTSILTGKNPARTHISTWINARGPEAKTKPEEERLLVPYWNTIGLTEEDTTLPGVLAANGYATWHLGKAHFGLKGHSGADPKNLGFQVNVGGKHIGAPGSYQGTDRYSRKKEDGHEYQVEGLDDYYGTETNLTDALTERACELIRSAEENDEQPFFMHLAHYAVHTPIQPHARFMEDYEESGRVKAQEKYASMVEGVDASLGAVLDALEETGELENTIVVLFSDNGGLASLAGPPTTNAPLRAGKGTCYEGGVRVPLVVTWPGSVEAGTVCEVPVVSDDLFPTLLTACGVPNAEWETEDLDGVDFGPLLRGAEELERGYDLVWHFPHYWAWPSIRNRDSGINPFSSIRVGDHRLVYCYEDEHVELYDLSKDLGERNDLSVVEPELTKELADRLAARLKELGAQTPRERETGEPVRLPHAGS
jgi:arylsulfatase A-like enzyme